MDSKESFLGNKRMIDSSLNKNKNRNEKNQEKYRQKMKSKKKQRKKENKKNSKIDNSKEVYINLLNKDIDINQKDKFKDIYEPLVEDSSTTNLENNLEINPEIKEVFDLFYKKIELQQKKIDSITKEKNIISKKDEEKKEEKVNENSSSEDEEEIVKKESRKQRKKRLKEEGIFSLAELKSKAQYPEIVEPWDTNADDPELLVHFKCMPNTVPVPIHWAQNGKYLQSQRGKVRRPYKLPDYIDATGISRLRLIEIPVHITLQQKTRRRMRPKLGRTDIDYQILYDAFFKHQTKKRLTKLGEIYYEGKEFDKRMKKYKPGKLSKNLRTALGITSSAIPPFVQNMQRYGPPPSYPFLKIPGVNIPDDDTSNLATPGLWDEPDFSHTKQFIWNFDTDTSHWYHYNKDDMIESDNDEKEMDDMGNDQDDLEISDEEKPDISGLFNNKGNVGKNLLEEEIKEDKIKEKVETKDNQNEQKEEEKFYKVIEKQDTKIDNKELNPIGYKYNLNDSKNNNNEQNNEEDKKINDKIEDEGEEEEEEMIENINKNIFN